MKNDETINDEKRDWKPILRAMARRMNSLLPLIDAKVREEIVDILLNGYCRECLYPEPFGPCHCWNGE